MNILFINANLFGHINPTLGFVTNLTKSGHQVDYFCSEAFSKQVQATGANWIGYDEALLAFLRDYKPTDRHPFYTLMEYMLSYDEVVLEKLITLTAKKNYDFIICDSYFGASCYLKQLISIPVVCSHSSFAMSKPPVPERMLVPGFHPQLDRCYEINHRICEKYQLKAPGMEEIFINKGERNIVYTTQSFNGDHMICEPYYLFYGPSIDRLSQSMGLDFSIIGERKVVYISLGSVNTEFLSFYQMCLRTFENTDYFVYMSIGNKCMREDLGTVPANFVVNEFLPQLQILQHADVFITHAGFNSVNEALYFGVPMLSLPLVNDQHMVAKKIASMQLGLMENMQELTEKILLENIEELIQNDSYKANCEKMSVEMKEIANPLKTIASLIEWRKNRVVH